MVEKVYRYITKYSSTWYTGMDEVLARIFKKSDLHFQ